ncbi:MAG: M20/M25/M40 family metallo-hydrolase [Candidatus Lokiarchaeota archaeon]|nr:M20/M25/M40 family metallo-hydrolase [Candidatus Lokiarchaeota archaeon]
MSEFSLNYKLLETLTNAFGPSGHEEEVQKIVREYGKPFSDETLYDKTGSIIFRKGNSGPKIMLSGHADEIGYIISDIGKEGILKISNLGGIIPPFQPSNEILIRPFKGGKDIIGIIQGEFSFGREGGDKIKPLDKLYVDIGCKSDKEVKDLGIRIGDVASQYAIYRTMDRTRFKKDDDGKETKSTTKIAVAKAFDDRIGVFIGLEILRKLQEKHIQHPNQIYFASTTQEEVGLRGARTSAHLIQPDLGFSLDITPAKDIPGMPEKGHNMGDGVIIHAKDGSMIANPKLKKFAIEIAEQNDIKFQYGFLGFGGTDAGVIHLTGIGAPSLFIGIPTRYGHSQRAMIDLSDVENAVKLMIEMIRKFDQETVESFTKL